MTNCKWFESLKVFLYKAYGVKPGKMLVHTGVIGWVMSSIAQITAIMMNDKIPKEQKMFMIPQEMADAIVNIVTFYAITNTFTAVAQKAVKCGKILPKNIRNYFTNCLSNKSLSKKISRLGKTSFNVEKHLPKYLKDDYISFKNGVDVIATLVGSIISCNIITPILRNMYASHRQNKNIAKLNEPSGQNNNNGKRINPFAKTSLYSFTNNSGLKI